MGRFFARTFPESMWRVRHFVLVSAALVFLPALAVGVWLANSPAAVDATGPAAVREAYLQHDFEDYYSSDPAAAFASEVFTNNVQVAIVAFAAGIGLCLPTAFILAFNGASIGAVAGLFHAAGQAPQVLGADPAPRPARADCRPAWPAPPACASGGRSSTPATVPAAWPWPRRPARPW